MTHFELNLNINNKMSCLKDKATLKMHKSVPISIFLTTISIVACKINSFLVDTGQGRS